MPETYGLPEPEQEPLERAKQYLNEAIAGRGVVRSVALYVLLAFGILLTATPVEVLGGIIAFTSLILLMATDGRLG